MDPDIDYMIVRQRSHDCGARKRSTKPFARNAPTSDPRREMDVQDRLADLISLLVVPERWSAL